MVPRPAVLRPGLGGLSLRAFQVLGLAIALVAPASALARPAPNRCPAGTVPTGTKCGIPVVTTIEALDGNGSASTISNDGNSTYTNAVDGVSSILLEDGLNGLKHDWRFDLTGSATRKVFEKFDAADAITSSDPRFALNPVNPSAPSSQSSKGALNVQCTFAGVDMVQLALNQSVPCPLINSFLYNGDDYYALNPAYSFTGFAEITDAKITCNAVHPVDGLCSDWYIDPPDQWLIGPPVAPDTAVGRLVHHIPKQGKNPAQAVNLGSFYMRFRIHVVRPGSYGQ